MMLQIVPSNGLAPSPSSSNSYYDDQVIDNFDLSKLSGSMYNESAFSSNLESSQQFQSFYCDHNSPAATVCSGNTSVPKIQYNDNLAPESMHPSYDMYAAGKATSAESCVYKSNATWHNYKESRNDFAQLAAESSQMAGENYFLDCDDWSYKSEWDNIRTQASVSSVTSNSSSSCCSSPDYQCCPPASPNSDMYQEVTLNLQNLLENSDAKARAAIDLHQNSYQRKPELLRSILEKSALDEGKSMRLLENTEARRNGNQQPLSLEGFDVGFQTDTKVVADKNCFKEEMCDMNFTDGIIAPVLSKAIEQLMRDVDNTSVMLRIPRDPKIWSVEDVREWLQWNSRQHNLSIAMDIFNFTGASLTSMNEQDFQQLTPEYGSLLFAQLEIWKVNCMEDTTLDVNSLLKDAVSQQLSSCIEISDEDEEEDYEMSDMSARNSPTMPSATKVTGRAAGGSHIHLWQFLKELLSMPQQHGCCIRWLDRSKGVFKIEDSVRVARLWGKRKNRPAMNYDKLSRSIRQYYKKGIMKKTERSQRLVYQFCTPYNV